MRNDHYNMRQKSLSHSASLANLQDLGLERGGSREFNRQTVAQRYRKVSMTGDRREFDYNFFMAKREQWTDFCTANHKRGDRLTLEDYVEFNRGLSGFTRELERDLKALALEKKLQTKIGHINNGLFVWSEQHHHVPQLASIYGMVRAFGSAQDFMFVDIREIRDRLLPFNRFEPFFRTPFYSDDGKDKFATSIYEFFTNLFWAFLRLYVSFPTGAYPRIDDDAFTLVDPFTREKIRQNNRARYAQEVEEPWRFLLVRLIHVLFERFLISEAIRWGKERDSNMVVPILTLINEALSVGLVRAEDCQQMMLNLQLLSEALSFVEETISAPNVEEKKLATVYIQEEEQESESGEDSVAGKLREEKVRREREERVKKEHEERRRAKESHLELLRCKMLVSQIVLQLIFVHTDQGFVASCRKYQHDMMSVNRKEVLRSRLQANKPLYRSVCQIVLRYLLSKHDLEPDQHMETVLQTNQCLILVFLTDARRNFFLESVDLVPKALTSFYINPTTPEVLMSAGRVQEIQASMLSLIRQSPPTQGDWRQEMLDLLRSMCQEVVPMVETASQQSLVEPDNVDLGVTSKREVNIALLNVPLHLELTWRGVTRFLLLFSDKFVFKAEDRKTVGALFALLKHLLLLNRPAQSLLFRGPTCAAYSQIFENHQFRTMRLLVEVFEKDFEVLNQSYQVFEIKMRIYQDLMTKYKEQRARRDGGTFRATLGSLLLFNLFLRRLMHMNLRAATEKWRKYDLVMQLQIFRLVADEVLPALTDPSFLTPEVEAELDLFLLERFKFNKKEATSLRQMLDDAPLNVAMSYLYFSFLWLFVDATTFVYPRTVFESTTKALKRLKADRLPQRTASAIMLHTQMIKLVDRFLIFPNNHLLYEGLREGEHINFKRDMLPKNYKQAHRYLEYELIWFLEMDINPQDQSDPRVAHLRTYVETALLPAIYKLAHGIVATITILTDPDVILNLRYYCQRLASSMENSDRTERIYKILGKPAPVPGQGGSLLQIRNALGKNMGTLTNMPTEEAGLLPNKNSLSDLGEGSKDLNTALPANLAGLGGRRRGASPNTNTKKGATQPRSASVVRALQGRSRSSHYSLTDVLEDGGSTNPTPSEAIENLLNNDLGKCRGFAKKVMAIVDQVYRAPRASVPSVKQEADAPDPLDNYRRTDRTWMFAKMRKEDRLETSDAKREKFREILTTARASGQSVVELMRRVFMNKEIKWQADKNPLVELLTRDRHREKYNLNVAQSCVGLLANMTEGDSDDNYESCFFLKTLYAEEIRAVNFLMAYSSLLREKLFMMLKETHGPAPTVRRHHKNFEDRGLASAFLRRVWAVSVNLTLFIYYKTFDDRYLKHHCDLSILLSDFIRNFFKNNFGDFKAFLSENGFGVTAPGTDRFSVARGYEQLTLMENPHPDLDSSLEPDSQSERRGNRLGEMAERKETESDQSDDERKPKSVKSEGSSSARNVVVAGMSRRSSGSSDNRPDTTSESIFIENFMLMCQLFENCSVARESSSLILPSDRENLFAVLVQAMTLQTEFVTGPCLANQLRIFDRQTYIWIGMLSRYVEDVTSNFYHLKLAVLEYLLGLIQGLDYNVINFVSQQLQVHSLFQVTMLMARLVYLHFIQEGNASVFLEEEGTRDEERRRRERQRRFRSYSKLNHFGTLNTSVQTRSPIRSPSEMLSLYQHNTAFNSHVIMRVIIDSYVFMRSVGDKIKFWHIYLEEREKVARKWDQSPMDHERETNVVFQFVLEMMFHIEVVYDINLEVDIGLQDHQQEKAILVDRIVAAKDGADEPVAAPAVPSEARLARGMAGDSSRFGMSSNMSRTLRSRGRTGKATSSKFMSDGRLLRMNNNPQLGDFTHDSTPKKRVQRRVYFQTPPICMFWTPTMKSRVMDGLPVTSTHRKQIYFYHRIRSLTLEAQTHASRVQRFGWLAYLVTPDAFDAYEIFLFLISLVQNILLMVYLTEEFMSVAFMYIWAERNAVQVVWAILLIVLSFVVVVLWLISRWRIYCINNLRRETHRKQRELTRVERIKVYFLDSLLLNKTFSTFFLNFVITILGLTVYTGIYTLNLFLAMKIFRPMSDIMLAIIHSGRSLISTLQLLVMVIFFYAFITMLWLTDRIAGEFGGAENCRSLFECFFNTFNIGFREPGGLGVTLETINDPGIGRFWVNWIMSISYCIIVKFVIEHIVAGIIIEAFGKLREMRNRREYVINNICPVCGMTRWDSERFGTPFDHHVEVSHNVWNYLKFMVRLDQLNEGSVHGFEFDIAHQRRNNLTGWFPRARVLKEDEGYVELAADAVGEDDEEEEEEEMEL